MLKIDDELRHALRKKRALTVDVNGDEVLVGMDHAETIFYLNFDEMLEPLQTSGEAELYKELRRRHLLARIQQLNQGSSVVDRRRTLRRY